MWSTTELQVLSREGAGTRGMGEMPTGRGWEASLVE